MAWLIQPAATALDRSTSTCWRTVRASCVAVVLHSPPMLAGLLDGRWTAVGAGTGDSGGGEVVMDTELLTLPHPRAAERAFVLRPLADICPDRAWVSTDGGGGGGRSVSELLAGLGGTGLWRSCHPAVRVRRPNSEPAAALQWPRGLRTVPLAHCAHRDARSMVIAPGWSRPDCGGGGGAGWPAAAAL